MKISASAYAKARSLNECCGLLILKADDVFEAKRISLLYQLARQLHSPGEGIDEKSFPNPVEVTEEDKNMLLRRFILERDSPSGGEAYGKGY